MSKIILKDKTEIETTEFPYLGAAKVKVLDISAAGALKEQLTPENLSEITTTNDAGLEVGHYKDQVLTSLTADLLSPDGVMVTIGLRSKTETELLREELADMRETYDGAIGDLGQAVSDMQEGGN